MREKMYNHLWKNRKSGDLLIIRSKTATNDRIMLQELRERGYKDLLYIGRVCEQTDILDIRKQARDEVLEHLQSMIKNEYGERW